jgi:KUP system potassium uptake protein
LLVLVILLVLGFQSSSNLAAAYGIAVTGTMVITACMLGVLTFKIWHWPRWLAGLVTGGFLVVDGAYFASNVTKIPDGGWFPLFVAGVTFTVLTTWATGRALMRKRLHDGAMPVSIFIRSAASSVVRVSGTSVFLSSSADDIPPALLHNLKHNHVLHARVVLLTVAIEPVPHIGTADRVALTDLSEGFYRIVLRYGFMDDPDVPAELSSIAIDPPFMPLDTSYYLSRQTLIAADRPEMALWREKLFAWMVRNAESAMAFFKLPTNRVVELGSEIEI